MPCEECRSAFLPNAWDTKEDQKRKAPGPPCTTCIPEKFKINDDALNIYKICSGQLIIAPMGGAVDMNIPAIKIIMDLYRIDDQQDCLERVLFIFKEIKKGEKCS